MSIIVEVVLGLTVLCIALFWYSTSTFAYWKSRGVPGPKPVPLFGTIGEVISGKSSVGTYLQSVYREYHDAPLVGIFHLREPVLVVRDLTLIKDIMIKDFSSFVDHASVDDPHDPLADHLFNLEPKRWRPMRAKLSPVFTSGKLREMFYLLIQCSHQFEKYLSDIDHSCVNIREAAGKFTTDVIGVCAFGLQANSLADGDSVFEKMGKRIFQLNFRNAAKMSLLFNFSWLYRIVGGFLQDRVLSDFFINLTRDSIAERRRSGIVKHDFIALLMKIKDNPDVVGDIELTDELLAAQLFVFFVGGFETSATTISNALYELALNPRVQDKLRDEISRELRSSGGDISYEVVRGMKYLDCVFKETLRKYPVLPVLARRSTNAYTFAGTNLTIPTGTRVTIPIYAIQRDPKYFPQPEVFRPERFGDGEAGEHQLNMSYLPFGDGPRNCIGSRFAAMQVKIGLITVLKSYVLDVCHKTDVNYEINKRAFLLIPKNGIFLNMKKLTH